MRESSEGDLRVSLETSGDQSLISCLSDREIGSDLAVLSTAYEAKC